MTHRAIALSLAELQAPSVSDAVGVANPYLDEIAALEPRALDATQAGPDWWMPSPGFFDHRNRLVRRYAWAIPNAEALSALVALGPIIEVGAGTGYWAWLVQQAGGDVVASDREPGHNHWCDHAPYCAVLRRGVEVVSSHADRALFLCWPPLMSEMAVQALALYAGSTVAYVGELGGGCCATDQFFDGLERDWCERLQIAIPQWWGVHDALRIFDRK